MKTRTVVIGVVILAIGGAMFIGGAAGALGSITLNRTFTQPHPGEYVSAEVLLSSTSGIVVASPASIGGLIAAQDLSLVNSTNIGTYSIPPSSTAAGSDIYKSLAGDYYYVAFSSTQPGTTVVATPARGSIASYGLLVIGGIVVVVAGVVVVIVGALQKSRLPDLQAHP